MTIKNFFDTDTLKLLVYKLDGSLFLTFDYNDIIKESIKCTDTLMSSINSGSCSIAISVKDSEKVDSLLAYNGELKVTLSSNNIVAFKGYLSNKTSLSVNSYGIPSVSLTLEDIGTKLFKKELYPDSLVDHYFTGTLKDFVELIKTQLGGLEYSSTEIANETRTISSLISSSLTIETLLKQVCLELGYVYYFNAGVLTFFKIPTDATSSQTVSSFAMNGTTAINVSKEIRKYKTCRVQTEVYENASNVLIYRDNSGGSDSGNCEVEIEGRSHYPALSDTGEPAQYEANDIESGKEIISISNLKPLVKYTGGKVTNTITQNGSKTITVDLYNDSTATAKVTRLECRADVVRVASTEVVKTSIATESQESDNVYELNCSWIHTKADCETIAKTIGSYFNYCDTKYTFYVRDDETTYSSSPFRSGLVGKVITLKEDSISGLDVLVLVTGAVYNTNANYTQYIAVGYSKFNMTATTISSSTKSQSTNSVGTGISSVNEYFAVSTSNSATPTTWSAKVPTMSAVNKYLWNYETINYSNGTALETSKKVIGVYGDKGEKGDKGDQGIQGIQGLQGEKGEQGIKGDKGDDGKTTYFHIKYSEVANPTSSSQMTETPSTYIGTYVDYTEADSTDPTKYSWSQFKGSQGEQGIAGKNGTDGKTQYLHIKYSNDGGTTFTGNSGEDVGDYIGQCTDFNSTDPTTVSSYKWSKIKGETGEKGAKGDKGETGNTGNGISSIVEYYAVSTSNTSVTSSWGTSVPTLTATNKYLWNYEVITYTDSSKKETAKRVIGVYGDKGATGAKGDKGDTGSQGVQGEKGDKGDTGSTGAKGDTGATGNGISSITNYYLATTSSSGVTRSTSGWSTTIQTITATKKYLWSYEDILYTNGNHSYSTPSIIGVYGDKGETGAKGDKGDTGATGATGAKGDKGDTGNGISSITSYYLATAAYSGITRSTSGWTTTVQTMTSTKKYLWSYEDILYTNGNHSYSTPTIIGAYGDTGAKGATGDKGETGEQGDRGYTAKTSVEYAMNSSPSLTTAQQQALTNWLDDGVFTWTYGQYIYKRYRTELVEAGTVSYIYYGRDTDLESYYTKQLYFNVGADRYSYPINKRADAEEATTITVTVEDRFYDCDSIEWTLNGNTITPTLSEGVYTFTLPVKEGESSYSLNVIPSKSGTVISAIQKTLIFTAVDETESAMFFGAVTSLSNVGTGKVLMNGDGCFLTQTDGDNAGNLVYIYQNGTWVDFNNSTLTSDKKSAILAKAQETALKYANMDGNTLSASYAYLGTLIADYINARQIGAETIVLTGDNGKLVGGDYTTKDGNFLANKGVYLDSEGTALFNDAKLKNCTIDSGEINNITITGAVNNSVLTTTLENDTSTTLTMGTSYSSPSYLGSEAKTYIKNNIAPTSDTIYNYSGIASGSQYTGIVNVTKDEFISKVNQDVTEITSSGVSAENDFCAVTNNILYKKVSADLYKSTDGGSTWSKLNFSTSATVGNTVYYVTNKGSLFCGTVNNHNLVCTIKPISSVPYFTIYEEVYDSNGNYCGSNTTVIPVSISGLSGNPQDFSNSVLVSFGGSYVDNCRLTYIVLKQLSGNEYTWKIIVTDKSFSTSSYSWDTSSSNHVVAQDYGTRYIYDTSWNQNLYALSAVVINNLILRGRESIYGEFCTTPAYSSDPTNCGVTWTTKSITWSENTSNTDDYATFYKVNGVTFAVVGGTGGTSGYKHSPINLYTTEDGTTWTFRVSQTSSASCFMNPIYYKGRYIFGDWWSTDLTTWTSTGLPTGILNCQCYVKGDYIYAGGSQRTTYRISIYPSYLSRGLNFINADDGSCVVHENSITDNLTQDSLTVSNGSTVLLNLPTTIVSSMNSYRQLSSLFSTTKTYFTVSNAKIDGYTRWDTSSNKEVTVSAYNGTPSTVEISPTVFKIDGTIYASSSWWIKNTTSVSGSVTPISSLKGVKTESIDAKSSDAHIGKVVPFNSISGDTINGTTINGDTMNVTTINGETVEATTVNTTTISATKYEGLYPIGAIYMSVDPTSPAELFGGSWEELKDKFLIGAGNSYAVNNTGGETAVTLTSDQMPSHRHSFYLYGYVLPDNYKASISNVYGYKYNNRTDGPLLSWDYGASSTSYRSIADKVKFYMYTTGGGKSHNNMPPYLAVYMWKRIS